MLCCLDEMCLRMKLSVSSSLRPQWGRSVQGPFWEAAALEPPQVQLFPLCPGALRQARPTCGGGEDLVCRLRWARQGVWASPLRGFQQASTINVIPNSRVIPVEGERSLPALTRCSSWAPPLKLNILNSWWQHVYTSFTLNELMMGVWNRISND